MSNLRVWQTSELEALPKEPNRVHTYPGGQMEPWDTAMIMLTSGSTGASKAVEIRHQQVLASLEGKATML